MVEPEQYAHFCAHFINDVMQALPGKASKDVTIHHQGLQRLSNGEAVPYSETLRIVQHEGSRAPRVMSATTRKPPGYIRNESGGMFTS